MNWYALFVETGREVLIQKWIDFFFNIEQCHSIVPKRKLAEKRQGKYHKVIKKMFPGYVFINTDMCVEVYYKLSEVPNIIRILNNGSFWTSISNEEIAPILKLIGKNDVVDYSKIFIENSKVFVKSGPLYGMEGNICKVDRRRGRAKVVFSLMGTAKTVDLGVEILQSAN